MTFHVRLYQENKLLLKVLYKDIETVWFQDNFNQQEVKEILLTVYEKVKKASFDYETESFICDKPRDYKNVLKIIKSFSNINKKS